MREGFPRPRRGSTTPIKALSQGEDNAGEGNWTDPLSTLKDPKAFFQSRKFCLCAHRTWLAGTLPDIWAFILKSRRAAERFHQGCMICSVQSAMSTLKQQIGCGRKGGDRYRVRQAATSVTGRTAWFGSPGGKCVEPPAYSCRRASMGSIFAARRAG